MNSDIMFDVLTKTNQKLAQQKRNVVLFLDNVSSHPPEFSKKFSHIKVIFLPKNTTSRLQPLDVGIIKKFKVQYQKLLVTHTLHRLRTVSEYAEADNEVATCATFESSEN